MRSHLLGAIGTGLALLAAACNATTDDAAPETAEAADSVEITIVGENIAFDVTDLEVPAGAEVTITFDHRDDAISHNLHVRDLPDGDARTEIESGPVVQTLTFTAPAEGSFTFVCDVHPAQMVGTLTVTE